MALGDAQSNGGRYRKQEGDRECNAARWQSVHKHGQGDAPHGRPVSGRV